MHDVVLYRFAASSILVNLITSSVVREALCSAIMARDRRSSISGFKFFGNKTSVSETIKRRGDVVFGHVGPAYETCQHL